MVVCIVVVVVEAPGLQTPGGRPPLPEVGPRLCFVKDSLLLFSGLFQKEEIKKEITTSSQQQQRLAVIPFLIFL